MCFMGRVVNESHSLYNSMYSTNKRDDPNFIYRGLHKASKFLFIVIIDRELNLLYVVIFICFWPSSV